MGDARVSWRGRSGLEAKKGWVSDAERMLFEQEGIATASSVSRSWPFADCPGGLCL